jgi:hypothetical protein
MVIEFLSFEGCPHSPILHQRLDEALQELGVKVTPVAIDLEQLFQVKDRRSAYGSPTILVDGRDLFGAQTPLAVGDPACRLYRPNLPTSADLIARLRQRMASS